MSKHIREYYGYIAVILLALFAVGSLPAGTFIHGAGDISLLDASITGAASRDKDSSFDVLEYIADFGGSSTEDWWLVPVFIALMSVFIFFFLYKRVLTGIDEETSRYASGFAAVAVSIIATFMLKPVKFFSGMIALLVGLGVVALIIYMIRGSTESRAQLMGHKVALEQKKKQYLEAKEEKIAAKEPFRWRNYNYMKKPEAARGDLRKAKVNIERRIVLIRQIISIDRTEFQNLLTMVRYLAANEGRILARINTIVGRSLQRRLRSSLAKLLNLLQKADKYEEKHAEIAEALEQALERADAIVTKAETANAPQLRKYIEEMQLLENNIKKYKDQMLWLDYFIKRIFKVYRKHFNIMNSATTGDKGKDSSGEFEDGDPIIPPGGP